MDNSESALDLFKSGTISINIARNSWERKTHGVIFQSEVWHVSVTGILTQIGFLHSKLDGMWPNVYPSSEHTELTVGGIRTGWIGDNGGRRTGYVEGVGSFEMEEGPELTFRMSVDGTKHVVEIAGVPGLFHHPCEAWAVMRDSERNLELLRFHSFPIMVWPNLLRRFFLQHVAKRKVTPKCIPLCVNELPPEEMYPSVRMFVLFAALRFCISEQIRRWAIS